MGDMTPYRQAVNRFKETRKLAWDLQQRLERAARLLSDFTNAANDFGEVERRAANAHNVAAVLTKEWITAEAYHSVIAEVQEACQQVRATWEAIPKEDREILYAPDRLR